MIQPVPNLSKSPQPVTFKEHALRAVKKAIITHRLKPGKFYSESGLAKELNVSRTPIREALVTLASMGFVTIIRGRGFQINSWGKEEITEIYLFRQMLELTIIRIAVPLITKEDIKKLKAIHKSEKKAIRDGDLRAHQLADRAIHLFLADKTQNRYLYSSLEDIRDLIEWFGYQSIESRPGLQESFSCHHLELFDMLQTQDVGGAVALMEQHMRLGRDEALKMIDQIGKE